MRIFAPSAIGHWLLLLLSLNLTANFVAAEDISGAMQFAGYDRRIAELESRLFAEKSHDGCSCDCCAPGWFVTADYLNWQIKRSDMAFAIDDPGGTGVPAAGSPVLSLDLGRQSGLRIGGGRRTASGWDFSVTYTFFNAEDQQAFAPGNNRVLAVQSSPSTGLTNADSVAASSEFSYDVFDIDAGHWFDINDSLSMLVFSGVRFASIDHVMNTRYDGGAFVNGQVTVPTSVDVFGGRIGGAFHGSVTERISFFAKTSFTVAGSEIQASRREISAAAVLIDVSRRTEPIVTAIDLSLGIRYSSSNWSLAAGYEWTNWFNVVSPLSFTDSFNGGTIASSEQDLGLHGLVIKGTFSY